MSIKYSNAQHITQANQLMTIELMSAYHRVSMSCTITSTFQLISPIDMPWAKQNKENNKPTKQSQSAYVRVDI